MNRFYRNVQFVLAALCGTILALGSVGFWMGYQAQRTAEMMRSHEWINNERCLAKVKDMSEPRGGFKFAVFGDIQIGTAQLPRLMRALKEEDPVAFIIQTGDAVSHADSGHYKVFLNELAHAGLWLPMFVVPGNHDVDNDEEKLFERYFGSKRLWFEYGGALFILADNSMGPLDDEQYDWLENLLEDFQPDAKQIFLFMHVQPIHWEGDGKISVEHLFERLFDLLKEYNVDYVFTGNWHGYHREERDGTIFVVNGRGGDFDHDERLTPCYFTIVEVRPNYVQDRQIELSPHLSLVLKSLAKDWFIANIGEFTMKNRFITACVMILMSVACVFFVVRPMRPNVSGRARRFDNAAPTKTIRKEKL